MKVEIIKCLKDNYSYLIIDEDKEIACVVDPSEAKPIIDYIENSNIKLKYILNTHHHYDHVGGNTELKKKYNSKVIGFKEDKDRIPGNVGCPASTIFLSTLLKPGLNAILMGILMFPKIECSQIFSSLAFIIRGAFSRSVTVITMPPVSRARILDFFD